MNSRLSFFLGPKRIYSLYFLVGTEIRDIYVGDICSTLPSACIACQYCQQVYQKSDIRYGACQGDNDIHNSNIVQIRYPFHHFEFRPPSWTLSKFSIVEFYGRQQSRLVQHVTGPLYCEQYTHYQHRPMEIEIGSRAFLYRNQVDPDLKKTIDFWANFE